jgi:hypothetical protein
MAQLWNVLESLDSSILKPFAHKRDEDNEDQELKISRKKRTFSTKKQTWDRPKTLNIALLPRCLKYGVLMEFSEGKKGSALLPSPAWGFAQHTHMKEEAPQTAAYLPQTLAGRKSGLSVRPHPADVRLPL